MPSLQTITEIPERPRNFSRPISSDSTTYPTRGVPTVRSIEAFHTPKDGVEPADDDETTPTFPTEPTFDDDTNPDLQPQAPQPTSAPHRTASLTSSSSSTTTASTNPTSTSTASSTSARPTSLLTHTPNPSARPIRGILKPTPTPIPPLLDPSFEDSASHHTVSTTNDDNTTSSSTSSGGTAAGGGGGTVDAEGKWHSSDWDTSGLSEAKRAKLLRKGVDPALYLEMKAARERGRGGDSGEGEDGDGEGKKGKKGRWKWVPGPLTGSSYVS